MGITCGIDWAEAHHDVALVDTAGATLAKLRIGTGIAGFTALLALIAEHADDPKSVPVAIETDKSLIVAALQAAGFTVYAINPRAVARYRERSAQAGGKSDPGDAIVLANILRTDAHMHRALPSISEGGLAVKALARQHQEAIWARQLTVNRLRSALLEFHPNALNAFPNLTHKAALEVIGAARRRTDLVRARRVQPQPPQDRHPHRRQLKPAARSANPETNGRGAPGNDRPTGPHHLLLQDEVASTSTVFLTTTTTCPATLESVCTPRRRCTTPPHPRSAPNAGHPRRRLRRQPRRFRDSHPRHPGFPPSPGSTTHQPKHPSNPHEKLSHRP